MADVISLSEAKAHLRINHDTEDSTIQIYVDAAVDYIINYLNTANVPANPSVRAAALLIVGGLYENRESTIQTTVKENPAVTSLLFPYRECMGI